MTDGPAFFRAIEADPDDDTPRLVYADWLDENAASDADRARAEFIRVQCELARTSDAERRWSLAVSERNLITNHGAAWAEPWPVKPLEPLYRRGFLDPVTLPGHDFAPHAARLADLMPLFHLRFVRARDAMKTIAACPQLAIARRLTFAGAWLRNAEMTDFAASPHLGRLQHLDLSHNQIGIRGATDLAAARMPRLLSLNVSMNPPLKDRGLLALALADRPALDHLDAAECGLRSPGVSGLTESTLPGRLSSLHLSRNPGVTSAAWLRFARAPWARLERLGLSNPAVTDEVVEALAGNPSLKTLRDLHLGAALVTGRGARAILESPHLRGLARLHLLEHDLDASLLGRLRDTFGPGFNPRG